MNRFINSSYM